MLIRYHAVAGLTVDDLLLGRPAAGNSVVLLGSGRTMGLHEAIWFYGFVSAVRECAWVGQTYWYTGRPYWYILLSTDIHT